MTTLEASAERAVALRQALSDIEAGRPPSVTALRHFPALAGSYADLPPDLLPELARLLEKRGIGRLYQHQRECWDRVRRGENVVVVTPTASGKTLCYNLPVLDTALRRPEARALYLFPTKALSQDQLAELHSIVDDLGSDLRSFTYDGDTPQDARKAIRSRAQIVVTNPDMLHRGILPHHTKWVKLFENLRYVVLDEVHAYRGVFGSHLANIMRRLHRICRFYGSSPQFICSSATIANPRELAASLVERPVELIEKNGAPRGEKYFIFYNPPVVNRQLGIRRSYVNETRDIALAFLRRRFQTIVFATSRLTTEILVTYLKDALERETPRRDWVRGYRGGYLPEKRREIEVGLRDGSVLGVVSTNALELGIDIGSLDVAVLAGYPGTIASTWQQAGRSGRRSGTSVAILVATSNPLNQYVINNPDYFFSGSPEHGLINPDNLSILLSHVKCAAFELPFRDGETFGRENLRDILEFLEEQRVLHHTGDQWHWTADAYPADSVSLRSVSSDNFVVVDETTSTRVVAEVDYGSAFSTIHPKAIYIVEGQQYYVERLDVAERRATVRQVEGDYFTDAITYTKVNILDRFESDRQGAALRSHGEVHVVSQVVGFKKIKFYTMENVGSGELEMPEQEMHTTAYWLTVPREVLAALDADPVQKRDGVVGLANVLRTVAMLFLMADRSDLGVALGDNSQGVARVERGFKRSGVATEPVAVSADYEPNIFLYDNYPGGIGFSEPLHRLHDRLLSQCRELIAHCACLEGCPSCVGPLGEVGPGGKEVALAILERITPGPA